MGIEFSASLVWGCPVEGEYFDLEDAHKPHSDFELIFTGNYMMGQPEVIPFIHIKKYQKNICSKYEYPSFNYFSLGTLQNPSKEEITQFLQWRFDNGFKTIQPPSGPLVGWHIIGWAAYYRAKSNNDGWYREIDGHPLRGVKVEVMPPIPVLIYDERLEEYIETGEFYMPDPKEWAGEKYYVDAIVNTEIAYIL